MLAAILLKDQADLYENDYTFDQNLFMEELHELQGKK
jgi:hypothetical protein